MAHVQGQPLGEQPKGYCGRLLAAYYLPGYQREGDDALRRKLKKMTVEQLRVIVKQQHIPCQNLGKRKKTDLIDVIAKFAANTDIGGGRKIGEAA